MAHVNFGVQTGPRLLGGRCAAAAGPLKLARGSSFGFLAMADTSGQE